ncbi:MAG: hypothetical protein JOZ19_17345 [Rubrobacter sp.]|nr:hypothetical protein [Rubrobacter sp.]
MGKRNSMREDDIVQITPAQPGWCAYGRSQDGMEFLSPIICWALAENSRTGSRYVAGLCAHRRGSVGLAAAEPGFIEYRYMLDEGEPTRERG